MANTYITGDQTKHNILEVSKQLFYENGYTDTTYNDISKTAQVNRALIPYHFKNKKILGIEIYHQIVNEFYQLIDAILDTSQFDTDFVTVLHTVSYYRLLADNVPFARFLSELQADNTTPLFTTKDEQEWLIQLGNKFSNMEETELNILSKMHIGIKKESIAMLCKSDKNSDTDQIASIHLRMLMHYAGYSTKRINELIEAAFEVANLLTFQIKDKFTIELKYN